MYCRNCGTGLPDASDYCTGCGQRQTQRDNGAWQGAAAARVGYSPRISDPAFARYQKNTNRWSAIFAFLLAVAAVVGFSIAGEAGVDGMENPQALYIGLGIGAMFLLIALFQILGRKRSRTWDGVVADKKSAKKQKRVNSGNEDYWVDYMEYIVYIRADSGKTHRIRTEDDDTLFSYYQIGDRIRHHAGLNSYEKYDKSKDTIIFCAACASLNKLEDEFCFRCKCPLLK
jgi:hypothetical protein